MMLLTRRSRFSASHRLHSDQLSEEENREKYGKCNNPYGHGHDYEIEITVSGPVDARTGQVVNLQDLDGLVRRHITAPFDHRNLNEEVPEFQQLVPTTENLSLIVNKRLRDAWPSVFPEHTANLERVRIYETERNIFET
jgi:6-pyruvoyltetrahydropterin/6-carboxytetrahydropterin synthase